MADHASLTVQAVLDRFNASEETLNQLSEKLRSLTLAKETSVKGATAITDAASALQGVASELRDLTEQAAAVQTEVRGAVEAASRFLDGTDLTALHGTVQQLAESSAAALEQQTAAREELATRLTALDERLATLEQSRQAEADLRKQLDAVRTGLSARKLKQLGIEA